ncbi:Fungal-trans domain-containing protein [Fusarium keratoplasticum]|nr:Fungal-trans domain-containing protein [Fusarium keratoplasticum]
MAELCDEATGHGYSWPFFTSFCLASAATVLIHAKYYDFVTGSVEYLVTVVERLITMLAENPLVELQVSIYQTLAELMTD